MMPNKQPFDMSLYGNAFFKIGGEKSPTLPVFMFDAAGRLIRNKNGIKLDAIFPDESEVLVFKDQCKYPQFWYFSYDQFRKAIRNAINHAPRHVREELKAIYPNNTPLTSKRLYAPLGGKQINLDGINAVLDAVDDPNTPIEARHITEQNLASAGIFRIPPNIPFNHDLHSADNGLIFNKQTPYDVKTFGWYMNRRVLRKSLITNKQQ